MQPGEIFNISQENFVKGEMIGSYKEEHLKNGVRTEEQFKEEFFKYLSSLLTDNESLEDHSASFDKYDFVLHHEDGSKSYFDVKSKAESSTTFTVPIGEYIFWFDVIKNNGDKVYVVCCENIKDKNQFRLLGIWDVNDLYLRKTWNWDDLPDSKKTYYFGYLDKEKNLLND
jgi:hypothetical protein